LKALLDIVSRISPTPRHRNISGHGKGSPKKFGMPKNRNIASLIRRTPAIISSHFDAVSITSLLEVRF